MRRLVIFLSTAAAMAAFVAATEIGSDENHITAAEFERNVDAGIVVLKRTVPLRVEDAIMLVRVSNTLLLTDVKKTKAEEEFEKLMRGRILGDRFTQALGEWIPNRGMGMFFKEHDLHWGGAGGNIRDRDRYVIVEQTKKEEANQVPEPTAASGRGSS